MNIFSRLDVYRQKSILGKAFFALLWLLSLVVRLISKLRNTVYDCGFAVQSVDAPVLSIGNIALGGTGKSPLVLAIAEKLKAKGHKPVIVSRGYGGSAASSGTVLCVSDGQSVLASVEQSGDEPQMFAQTLSGVPIYTCAKRVLAARQALLEHPDAILLLDDGFQHRALKRNADIVLLDALKPWGNGHRLPAGPLREGLSALKRADLLLLTRCERVSQAHIEALRAQIEARFPKLPVLESSIRAVAWQDLNSEQRFPLEFLKGKSVFAFCSIAQPESFWQSLSDLGLEVRGHHAFADHHAFTIADQQYLQEQALKHDAQALVCTHKDAVKLKPDWDLPLIFLHMQTKIKPCKIEGLSDILKEIF